jgi:hypothetical protein
MKFHLVLLIIIGSYFFTKLFNCSKFNDGKYLQLSGIEKLEWIVITSMLNVAFHEQIVFKKGLNEDVY